MVKPSITTKLLVAVSVLVTVNVVATPGFCDTKKGEKIDGKKEFAEHCAVCHPDGGNIINAQRPLTGKALKANGVKNVQGIIGKMRHPGPGMTQFDEKTISNQEAKAIAVYVLKTFK
jgi:cytochrome c6